MRCGSQHAGYRSQETSSGRSLRCYICLKVQREWYGLGAWVMTPDWCSACCSRDKYWALRNVLQVFFSQHALVAMASGIKSQEAPNILELFTNVRGVRKFRYLNVCLF